MKSKHSPIIAFKRGEPDFFDGIELPYDNANPSLIKILNCGIETFSKQYVTVRNYGRSFVMLFIKEGQLFLERNGKREILKKDDLVLISFKEYSRLFKDEKTTFSNYFLCVYGPIIDGFYESQKDKNATLIHKYNPGFMLKIIQKAINDHKNGCYSSHEISRLIYDLILEIDDSNKENLANLKIGKILEYIGQYYQREIKLEELSEISGLSKFYICRLFKKEKGVSFNTYINDYRLKKAKELLVSTKLNNYEIALQTGFGDSRNLYYYFKKRLNITPQIYRSIHQLKI